jgi:hypothetical protein
LITDAVHMSLRLLPFVFLLCTSMSSALAGEFWLSAGGGSDSRGRGAWQMVTSAPLGGIDAAGPRLRAFLSESKGDNSAAIEGGWSFGQSTASGDVLAGVEMRDEAGRNRLSPTVSVALETMTGPGGVSALAMLRPAYGESWAEVRPWFWLDDCWKLGLVAATARAPDETGFRAGVFTGGYRVGLPLVGELYLGGELGLEREPHGGAVTPYGGVNLGLGF